MTSPATRPEIQTLQDGTIDMQFYRRQAARARAAAIQAGVSALGRWLKARLRIQPQTITPYRLSH